MKNKYKPSLFYWSEYDDIFSYVHRVCRDLYVMWPRIKLFGLRYVYDFEYRRKSKNRLYQRRRKILVGSGFLTRRHKIREQLIRRDGMGCNYCHIVNRRLTIDHVVPTVLGGNSKLENLQLLCDECHNKKTKEDVKKMVPHKQARVSWVRGESCAIRE